MEVNVFTIKNKLLCTIQVPLTATVKYVKKEVAKRIPKLHEERQSLRSELKGVDQKDGITLASLGLQNGSNIFIKDLGPQISWRTVFILEYVGPLIIYGVFALRPSFIYNYNNQPFTIAALTALICWTFHYVKRLYETVSIHRFSHNTMPLRNLFKNCAYYWGFAGYVAVHINHPLYTPPCIEQTIFGAILFAACEFGNLSIHLLLRDLRPAGSNIRKIPVAGSNIFTKLYNYVSCPNYTYEFGAWFGFFILTNCIPVFLFAVAGMYQMTIWAIMKHNNYMKEFKDYPRRKAILPFII